MFSKIALLALVSLASSVVAQVPNLPLNPNLEKGNGSSCAAAFLTGFTGVTLSCNISSLSNINVSGNTEESLNQATSGLDSFCNPTCRAAFASLISNATSNCNVDVPILTSNVVPVNNTIIDSLIGATITNVTVTVRALSDIGCTRSSDNSTYCVVGIARNVTNASAVKSANGNSSATDVLNSVLTNQTIICTGCSKVEFDFIQQYKSANPAIASLIYGDVNVDQAVSTWNNTLNNCPAGSTSYTPPGGNSGNKNAASSVMASISGVATAVVFAVVLLA